MKLATIVPEWVLPEGFDEKETVESVYEGIAAIDYETYTRIERDIRSSELLAATMVSLAAVFSSPIPKEIKGKKLVEAWKSMRLAKATQIIDQLVRENEEV